MALHDDFLDLSRPFSTFEKQIVIGAAGEADLVRLLRQVGWPVRDLNRSEVDADHQPLWVGDQPVKMPDLMVGVPCLGMMYVEVRVKQSGAIPGLDCYGMNTSMYGCTDRWKELRLVQQHTGKAALAIYDPTHGWLFATVSKLEAVGLKKHRGGRYWLIPRKLMTPLQDLLRGNLALGLVLDGRAV